MQTDKKTSHMAHLRHELLNDLVVQANDILVGYNVPKEKAEHCALAIANHMANHWGGLLIYFPKDDVYRIASRDIDMYNEFNGTNHAELARKYDICQRTVYKIITKMRALTTAKNQPDLFSKDCGDD